MDKVKEALSKVTTTTGEEKAAEAPSGRFPGPEAYGVETQKGKVVGIQAEMDQSTAPESEEHEAKYGFESYKAAGKLIGKKTIVTGGDSGIGRAVAVHYAMEGADVALVYLPEEQVDAEKTAALIRKNGQECLLIAQDIRDEQGCKLVIETVLKSFGKIDVLVNNASVMYDTPSIDQITTEQFDRTIKTNIYGTFFLTRAVVPHLKEGSSIIVTSSQVAYAGPPTLIDYAMTKGAQVSLVRSLSNNLVSKGIRVNAVCPGPVWTPLQPAAMDAETMKSWHSSPAPIGRIGQPSELAPAYVFLASSDSSFVSGQSIHVNGGAVVNG